MRILRNNKLLFILLSLIGFIFVVLFLKNAFNIKEGAISGRKTPGPCNKGTYNIYTLQKSSEQCSDAIKTAYSEFDVNNISSKYCDFINDKGSDVGKGDCKTIFKNGYNISYSKTLSSLDKQNFDDYKNKAANQGNNGVCQITFKDVYDSYTSSNNCNLPSPLPSGYTVSKGIGNEKVALKSASTKPTNSTTLASSTTPAATTAAPTKATSPTTAAPTKAAGRKK